jgi:2-methylcitrate dehydratase PrpD
MLTAAETLAKFAAGLTFDSIPSEVVARAKACIIDTVAVATYGLRLPWGRAAVDYASRYGGDGPCSIIGVPKARAHAPFAALANGVLAHSYELDNSGGGHAGAAFLPPVLAACEETNADGKTAITAFVAGCEVSGRLSAATHYKLEKWGFHGPAIAGTYGSAIAAGRVLGLNEQQLGHALGIAGSLSSGLLAFSSAKSGGMVKRLHLGRVAESGILAARLASAGYTGPETILEGKFGYLEAYCREGYDADLLTADLGKKWKTSRINLKLYACHGYAQSPVQALRELMKEHQFQGHDVARVLVEGSPRIASQFNILEPSDIMQGQYSVPFCIALSLYRDPADPNSFDASAISDADIRAVCRKVELRTEEGCADKFARVTVWLKAGNKFSGQCLAYKGMTSNPLTQAELRNKFMLLCSNAKLTDAEALYSRLERLEALPHFSLG